MGALDSQPLKITCAHCSNKITKQLRWFKQHGNACPFCHAILDTHKLRRMIEEIERQLANVERGRF